MNEDLHWSNRQLFSQRNSHLKCFTGFWICLLSRFHLFRNRLSIQSDYFHKKANSINLSLKCEILSQVALLREIWDQNVIQTSKYYTNVRYPRKSLKGNNCIVKKGSRVDFSPYFYKPYGLLKYSPLKIQPSNFHLQSFFYQSYNSNTNQFHTKSFFGQNTHPKLNQHYIFGFFLKFLKLMQNLIQQKESLLSLNNKTAQSY